MHAATGPTGATGSATLGVFANTTAIGLAQTIAPGEIVAFSANYVSANPPVTPNGDFTVFTVTQTGIFEITVNLRATREATDPETAAADFSVYVGGALFPQGTVTLPAMLADSFSSSAGGTFILNLAAGQQISIHNTSDETLTIVASYFTIKRIG